MIVYITTNGGCIYVKRRIRKRYKKIPLLSEQEFSNLYYQAKAGDIEARNEIVKHNLGLSLFVASKYRGTLDFMELVSVCNEALINAVDHYDINRGATFASYAVPCLRNNLVKYISKAISVVDYPANSFDLYIKYKYIKSRMTAETGKEPDDRKVALELGISKETLNYLKEYEEGYYSFDQRLSSDDDKDSTLLDIYQKKDTLHVDEQVILSERSRKIKEAVNHAKLTARQKEVLDILYSKDDMTFDEVGKILGTSKQNISIIVKNALNKLYKDKEVRKLASFLGKTVEECSGPKYIR